MDVSSCKRILGTLAAAFLLHITCTVPAEAQCSPKDEFRPMCDSLSVLLEQRTTVSGRLELDKVLKRKGELDFYFTVSLGDWPLREGDYVWLRERIRELMPERYRLFRIGEIYSRRDRLRTLETALPGDNGIPSSSRFRARPYNGPQLVSQVGGRTYDKGLSGRTIAIWPSHGMYYQQNSERWRWQRPCLFGTVEDMMSTGFVLQYLVPMIENAGGYALLPRERDTNPNEVILDNDMSSLMPTTRNTGTFTYTGEWSPCGTGFADTSEVLCCNALPFQAGTSLTSSCVQGKKSRGYSRAVWTAEIPEDGNYAVYVSYVSSPSSTESASYTVVHDGGTARFSVNQKMGGGTWVYLGTFPFTKGGDARVELDNAVPEGYRYTGGRTVSADAVKIGGGMGNIARRDESDPQSVPSVSGMPRYAEGARYWLQWSGADTTIFSQNGNTDDYRDDFMSRGDWVGWLAGGSSLNPKAKGLNIPVDMAFAFHSDAGVTPNDSTIGTLAIYTQYSEFKKNYPSGGARLAGRELADMVQTQVTGDIRKTFDNEWNRRSIWDRSYRESRTPPVPAMLLETFSHQNFADMRYALDPSFRFTVGRAIYKGILKFLSSRYGTEYAVQPLPVSSFSVRLDGDGKAELSWEPVEDSLEPTASPQGYIIYTRIGDGPFDRGRYTDSCSVCIPISPGSIYSFRVTAVNRGGESFPSETLSAGIPEGNPDGWKSHILVVNNFTRISGPAWFDTPQYAGFDYSLDRGVPYMQDISFVGDMHQFRREMPWTDDDNPGFGASWQENAGKPVAGNTFDYPYIHGKAIMASGHAFCSMSAEAFAESGSNFEYASAIDLICGKQVSVSRKGGRTDFSVFSPELQRRLTSSAEAGKDILVSGAYIGTDVWDRIYPAYGTTEDTEADSVSIMKAREFAEKVLGYRWRTCYGGRTGKAVPSVRQSDTTAVHLPEVSYPTSANSRIYCVETADGIEPASSGAKTVMRYPDTGISASICYDAGNYRTVCLGFPLEVIEDSDRLQEMIGSILKYFGL